MQRLAPLFVAILAVSAVSAASARTVVRRVAHASARVRTSVCDRFASTVGSDRFGRGTYHHPFQTLTQLDRSLRPGQTGCLEGGTYGGLSTWHDLASNGANNDRITLRAVPGQVATVVGWVEIQGSYTTVEHLRIDGSNTLYGQHPPGVTCRSHVSQPLTIAGQHDILQYVDYFQSIPALRGNGIGVGFQGSNADDTVIRHNKIHDVGGCDFYDHLIYLAGGRNAEIMDNWMWDDPHGWGVKLDPGPVGARIWGNVIDRAGAGFYFGNSSGSSPTADNQVFDNVVMNSLGMNNPDAHYYHAGALVTATALLSSSTGNQVFNNDGYHNAGGVKYIGSAVTPGQLDVTSNTTVTPHFVDATAHDYARLSASAARARRAKGRRARRHRR